MRFSIKTTFIVDDMHSICFVPTTKLIFQHFEQANEAPSRSASPAGGWPVLILVLANPRLHQRDFSCKTRKEELHGISLLRIHNLHVSSSPILNDSSCVFSPISQVSRDERITVSYYHHTYVQFTFIPRFPAFESQNIAIDNLRINFEGSFSAVSTKRF